MTRTALLLASAVLAAALAGCGSSASTTAASGQGSPSAATDSGTPAGGSGSTGCAAVTKDDMGKYIVYTQLLAQVRNAASMRAVTTGAVGDYTPEKFQAILDKLAFLKSDPQAAAALDALTKDNAAVKSLESGSPTQADFDAYQKASGGVAGVLRNQLAITVAATKACPNL